MPSGFKVFAQNYRGFSKLEIDSAKLTFIVGDNSSGKSSILYLVDCILKTELDEIPRFDDKLSLDPYDYFSPYFDYSDVTLGFATYGDDENFAKLITLRYNENGRPDLARCSVFFPEYSYTLRKRGSKILVKYRSEQTSLDFDNLMSTHQEPSGFETTDLDSKISICSPTALVLAIIEKNEIAENSQRILFRSNLPDAYQISPVRSLPEKFYSASRKISKTGTYFAVMWKDIQTTEEKLKNRIGLDLLEKFGRNSGLFDEIEVEPVSKKLPDSPLLVSVTKGVKRFLINQVGVGVSQVVPILVHSVFFTGSKEPPYMLVQQPELHMHPKAQAALGDFYYAVSSMGALNIIETHSNYIIDRFRANLRDAKNSNQNADSEDFQIIFCENTSQGNEVHKINILSNGQLEGAPDNYYDFFVKEVINTMF